MQASDASEIAYESRRSILRKAGTFRLVGDRLIVPSGKEIPLSAIREIRCYDSPGLPMLDDIGRGYHRTVIWPHRHRAIVLISNFYRGLGKIEDHSPEYWTMAQALVQRTASASPSVVFIVGMPRALMAVWLSIVALAIVSVPLMILMFVGSLMNGTQFPVAAIGPFIILVGICFGVVHIMKELWLNRPRRYDPRGSGGMGPLIPFTQIAGSKL